MDVVKSSIFQIMAYLSDASDTNYLLLTSLVLIFSKWVMLDWCPVKLEIFFYALSNILSIASVYDPIANRLSKIYNTQDIYDPIEYFFVGLKWNLWFNY